MFLQEIVDFNGDFRFFFNFAEILVAEKWKATGSEEWMQQEDYVDPVLL